MPWICTIWEHIKGHKVEQWPAPLPAGRGTSMASRHNARRLALPMSNAAGVGDYARSNGNTWEVVQAAHAMRNGAYRSNSLSAERKNRLLPGVACRL